MDVDVEVQFKKMQQMIIDNEKKLSELKGRLDAAKSSKNEILSNLRKEYNIDSVEKLDETIEQLTSVITEKMNELKTTLSI
jgi:hypothetical protein